MIIYLIMKLQEKNGQFSLTLPKAVIRGLGWQKEDVILVRIAGANKIELMKVITLPSKNPSGNNGLEVVDLVKG
jgi:hypothetical protein